MSAHTIDVTILTCQKYLNPKVITTYEQNILDERKLITQALEDLGLKVHCTAWDDAEFDWSQTRAVVFRTIWDYFERYDEFSAWIEIVKAKTQLVNSYDLIQWNIDKHYLEDLQNKGVAIVPTEYVDTGSYRSIAEVCLERDWQDVVIKPAIAGGAFHTHKVLEFERADYEEVFENLVAERDMLIQPFVPTISSRGEASLMVFNGKFTHAILKKPKQGDYRVQDDWGGTVHPYSPTQEEITFAEDCFKACNTMPAYGRADILWGENGDILLGELEIVEPELWIRNDPASARQFAQGVLKALV
ncbi:ATP-grasp domain-containing protein [Dokdonia donghaensis]|uniref:Prokaryotic glutathione synthetase ATP-binding domain-containing protein n=1 Tax=Dokdonia donghaensis DSW-1 TaxID=1300343 RepID=A0A0A2GZM8_9FLAO|nr:hypothetical protein [Dokdonia donghaensis]ANH59289.1 Cycloserine biosynthesis protein DcsG [Dokdonia donghaensis DSW-1]KGO07988.1 hypothetical protein NV36_07450 [Dokdonia donghaensis DSW-1]